MPLLLVINGQSRTLEALSSPASLAQVIAGLELKGDRIAVEHNGNIAPRSNWSETTVGSGDRLEVVHFVGGGSGA
jgi:sulfur carrier protein